MRTAFSCGFRKISGDSIPNDKIINRQGQFVAGMPKEWENVLALTSEGRKEGRGMQAMKPKEKRTVCGSVFSWSGRTSQFTLGMAWAFLAPTSRSISSTDQPPPGPCRTLKSELPEDSQDCPWEWVSGKSSLCIGASPAFMDCPFSWLAGVLPRDFAKKPG